MELKEFKDYSAKDKKKILLHWWHYFGKIIYTKEELITFKKMIDDNSDEVMMLAVTGYICKLTSQPIIKAMRVNKLDELKATLPILKEENEEFKASYRQKENDLLKQLINTYNNPEPSVPMDITIEFGQERGITKIR